MKKNYVMQAKIWQESSGNPDGGVATTPKSIKVS